jgi:outer membrane lipoprotein-sorting protein
MKRLSLIPCLAIVLCGVSGARADELETITKQIASKFREHKSVTASITKKMESKQEQSEIKFNGEGKYEFVQRGEKSLYRIEKSETMEITGNVKLTNKVTELEIGDGEFVYNLKDQSLGGKRATKSRPDAMKGWNVPAMLEAMQKDSHLKLLPEAKVGETSVYVLEAAPKVPRVGQSGKKTVYSFAKDTGVLMKQAQLDDKGQENEVLTFSDVKLNEKIDPDRFKFTAPQGVTVVDQTGGAVPAKP